MLITGVVRQSLKPNEKRVPIFPEHIALIEPELRSNLYFESGYGIDFGVSDNSILENGCNIASRVDLFAKCDLLILPKPVEEDLLAMKKNQILWGWPHCVQQHSIAQAAIDNKLTLIAWEAMHHWSETGVKLMHSFYKNNELAGYAAIHHALQINGIDGFYGPRRLVVILGYGSVARGVIHALHSRGFNNILVLTRRPVHLVSEQHPDVYFAQLINKSGAFESTEFGGENIPLIETLEKADIICNCVLQDTNDPMMFIQHDDIQKLKSNSLIIDISCDEGMGFPFAKPTTFHKPIFKVGNNITYYSVDHTPSYLWNAASREISKSILPYLKTVMNGNAAWESNLDINKSIEIENGEVINNKILTFQKRETEYPYKYI